MDRGTLLQLPGHSRIFIICPGSWTGQTCHGSWRTSITAMLAACYTYIYVLFIIAIDKRQTVEYRHLCNTLYATLSSLNKNVPLLHTQWGQTAVYLASVKGHSEVVKLLVQAGADLELQREVY